MNFVKKSKRNSLLTTTRGLDTLINGTCEYFSDQTVADSKNGRTYLIDAEIDLPASDCSTLQVAGMLSYWASETGNTQYATQASNLVNGLSFESPFHGIYNVPIGKIGAFDLAEVGAGFSSLIYSKDLISSTKMNEILSFISNTIPLTKSSQRSGAYYKNVNTIEYDVLNGDIYAALVLSTVDRIQETSEYLDEIQSTVAHLASRFNVNERLGWPYSESWNGDTLTGYSLSYQATIVAWGAVLFDFLSNAEAQRWKKILWSAQQRVALGIESGNVELNEAPRWSKNWENTWEIELSFSRWDVPFCISNVNSRLESLAAEYQISGMNIFKDSRRTVSGHTPMGSTLRKSANFASVLCSMLTQDRISP